MIAVCDCGILKQKPVFKKSQPIVRNSMKVYLTWPFTPQDLILQAQEQTPWPKFLFEKKGGAIWCQPNKLILFLEKRVCERKKKWRKIRREFFFREINMNKKHYPMVTNMMNSFEQKKTTTTITPNLLKLLSLITKKKPKKLVFCHHLKKKQNSQRLPACLIHTS